MGLFRKKGRSDIDAWAKVMIQGYKKGMPIDKAVLEQATDQSIRNETQKENIRQKRKQKQDAFWEVTGVSYMMDEFSDAKKKKK